MAYLLDGDEGDDETNEYICPISQEVMVDPVSPECGHTFERKAIVQWFQRNAECPVCRARPGTGHLTPNFALKSLIENCRKDRQFKLSPKAGAISLCSTHTGKFLSVSDDGKSVSVAPHDRAWERFTVMTIPGTSTITSASTSVGLQSCHGTFLSARSDGTIGVATHRKSWETFEVKIDEDNKVSFRTCHGRWLSVSDDGKVGTAPHCRTWEYFSPVEYQVVHSFDLGGSGLKHCVWHANLKTGQLDRVSKIQNLGRCETNKSPADWVREGVPNLDRDVRAGGCVGFSLAGLDKLWVGGKEPEGARKTKITQLFNLDDAVVGWAPDGVAHLVAAEHRHRHGGQLRSPHVNFALGTGVGFGCTNSKGEPRASAELKHDWNDGRGARHPWDIRHPTLGKGAWEVLGARGVTEGKEEAFGKAWREFFEQRWLKLHREKKWTQPKSVSFSGGVLKKPGVVKALKKHCVEESLTGVSSIVFVEEPDVAGLLGAAVLARKGKKLP